MRILMAIEGIYPDLIGGSHIYGYDIARTLVARGHEVGILTATSNAKLPAEQNINGIHIYRCRTSDDPNPIRRYLKFRKAVQMRFGEVCLSFSPQLIHAQSPRIGAAIYQADTWKLPKVYSFHSPHFMEEALDASRVHYPLWSWKYHVKAVWLPMWLHLLRECEGTAVGKSHVVLTLSSYMREQAICHHRVRPDRIRVVPGGIDINHYVPASDRSETRKSLGISEDTLLLLTARRLVARMGLESLVEAMRTIKTECPNALLLVAGGGPLEGSLRDLARNCAPNNIRILGRVPELLPYYQAADLFILPTEYLEGFGLVTAEAMACETPVVATPVSSSPEILSPFDPTLLTSGTRPEQLARGITRQLKNMRRLQDIRPTCRRYIQEHYTLDHATDGVEDAYRLAVAEAPPRRPISMTTASVGRAR